MAMSLASQSEPAWARVQELVTQIAAGPRLPEQAWTWAVALDQAEWLSALWEYPWPQHWESPSLNCHQSSVQARPERLSGSG